MEGCVFRELLLASAPDLSDARLDLCVEDLVSMETEGFTDEALTFTEWLRRLGGPANIPVYAECLVGSAGRGTN